MSQLDFAGRPPAVKQPKQYPCDCCESLTPINGSTMVGAPFLCAGCKVDPPPAAGRGRPPEPWELPYE